MNGESISNYWQKVSGGLPAARINDIDSEESLHSVITELLYAFVIFG
jgi:hypothetical protein